MDQYAQYEALQKQYQQQQKQVSDLYDQYTQQQKSLSGQSGSNSRKTGTSYSQQSSTLDLSGSKTAGLFSPVSTPSSSENPTSGRDAQLSQWADETGSDYDLLYFGKYGTYPGGASGGGGGYTGVSGYAAPSDDSQDEWSSLMRKWNDGSLSAGEAQRLQDLARIRYWGGNSGGGSSSTGGGISGGSTTGGTPSTEDMQAEWSALMDKWSDGTITADEARRLEYLTGILYWGKGSGGTGGGGGGTIGGGGGTGDTIDPFGGFGGGGAGGGGGGGGAGGGDASTTGDLQAEWSSLMDKWRSGSLTALEAQRLYELTNILFWGGTGSGDSGGGIFGGGTGSFGGTFGGAGGNPFNTLPDLPSREQEIRDMYDAQLSAEKAALQEQGNQALSDAKANRKKIAGIYNAQRNASSTDWERQRRNFLEGANTSGLNTGTGSQAELSMMGMQQRSQTALGNQQAQAQAEADRNIADIKRNTQAAINEAVMKNDYQKAAALLDEYKEQYNRTMDRAEALAQYGDFSGYADIYGEDAARQMFSTWAMTNPEVAFALGLISQSQYAQLVLYKQYPQLALAGLSGSGISGGGGGGGGSNPASTLAGVAGGSVDELIQGILDRELKVIDAATKK